MTRTWSKSRSLRGQIPRVSPSCCAADRVPLLGQPSRRGSAIAPHRRVLAPPVSPWSARALRMRAHAVLNCPGSPAALPDGRLRKRAAEHRDQLCQRIMRAPLGRAPALAGSQCQRHRAYRSACYGHHRGGRVILPAGSSAPFRPTLPADDGGDGCIRERWNR